MALPKGSVDSILSFDASMFPTRSKDDTVLSFFTPEERDDIKKKIQDYQAVKGSGHSAAGARTGGGGLLVELGRVEYFKAGLLAHIQAIRDILRPRETSRTTLAQKEQETQLLAIESVAKSFSGLTEKLLRQIAESVLGDRQIEYTPQELPKVLATQQITGRLLEPGV